MGTTLTALRFSNGQVGLAHVGDSRAYLMRGESALADHPRRHLRPVAGRRRPADPGRGGQPSAQVGDPAGADRRRGRARRLDPRGPRRRPLPALHRRADRRRVDPDPVRDAGRGRPAGVRRPPGRAGPARRRPRQRHLHRRRRGRCRLRLRRRPAGHRRRVRRRRRSAPAAHRQPGRAGRRDQPARAPPPPAPVVRNGAGCRAGRCSSCCSSCWPSIAGVGTYAWTQQQYFVGADGDEVAIFRGVDTQFGPLKFFSVQAAHRPAGRRSDPGRADPGAGRHHRLEPAATPTDDRQPAARPAAAAVRCADADRSTPRRRRRPTPTTTPTPDRRPSTPDRLDRRPAPAVERRRRDRRRPASPTPTITPAGPGDPAVRESPAAHHEHPVPRRGAHPPQHRTGAAGLRRARRRRGRGRGRGHPQRQHQRPADHLRRGAAGRRRDRAPDHSPGRAPTPTRCCCRASCCSTASGW